MKTISNLDYNDKYNQDYGTESHFFEADLIRKSLGIKHVNLVLRI